MTARITKINVVATVAAVVTASLLLIVVEYRSLRASLETDLAVQAHIFGDNGASALVFGDAAAARQLLDSLDAAPQIVAAELREPDGSVLAAYRSQAIGGVAGTPWEALAGRFPVRFTDIEQRIEFDGQKVGTIRLRASLDALYGRLLGYAGTTLLVSIGSIAVAMLLIARMRRTVSQAEQRLHFLAHTDPVTRLPNRYSFSERLAFALARVERFGGAVALLIIDLDNFKLVNDTFGHQVGDLLLGKVAERIGTALRHGDVVCRLGGDEFAVILEHSHGSGDATTVAEKMLATLVAPFAIGPQEIYVSASAGISFAPQDTGDLDELIRNADTALYAAKSKGKQCIELFMANMNERARQRLSLESRLRRALERDEFVLHYQPQLDLASGRIVGVEALVRWNEGGKGLVGPAQFIPVAEDSGLIGPLGAWVLRTACVQASCWQRRWPGRLFMSVNLSARQLEDDNLVESVLGIATESDLAPELLELEVTESALMRNPEASAGKLIRLSEVGINLAIDDFGTGYSSMAYLKRFPIDKLKIDRSFVAELTESRDDTAIVAAIIAMSQSLAIQVIAEGVETEAQLQKLKQLGCDQAQGYLVARPLDAESFEAFFEAVERTGVARCQA